MRHLTVFPKSTVAKREKVLNLLLGSSVIVLFLVGWELLFQLKIVNPLFISAPSRVVLAEIAMIKDGSLLKNLTVSAKEFLLGYGAAVLIGFPFGIILGWFKLVRGSFGPFMRPFRRPPVWR